MNIIACSLRRISIRILKNGRSIPNLGELVSQPGFCPYLASYHCKHVYLQLQEWAETTDHHNPLEWGWEKVDRKLFPLRTNLSPAFERLIKVMRCNC
jgi:hypothetical protein